MRVRQAVARGDRGQDGEGFGAAGVVADADPVRAAVFELVVRGAERDQVVQDGNNVLWSSSKASKASNACRLNNKTVKPCQSTLPIQPHLEI